MLRRFETLAKANGKQVINVSNTPQTALCFNFQDIPNTHTTFVSVSFMYNNKKTSAAVPPFVFNRIMKSIEHFMAMMEEISSPSDESEYHFVNASHLGLTIEDLKRWDCHRLFLIPQSDKIAIFKEFTDTYVSRLLKFPELHQIIVITRMSGVSSLTRFYEE